MEGIKPCPFCGGEGKLSGGGTWGTYYVECIACGSQGAVADGTATSPQDAIGLWNKRVSA